MVEMSVIGVWTALWSTLLSAALCSSCPSPLATPGNFNLYIVGRPSSFISSTMYRLELDSEDTFRQAQITVDGDKNGWLQAAAGGGLTFSEACMNMLVLDSDHPRRSVFSYWTAPAAGCATIRASIKTREGWTFRMLNVCALLEEKPEEKHPECCACDHAKYSMTFTGLWSPKTHEKDFPKSKWLTHFSDVIGATHGSDFVMWGPGREATYGLKQLAEYGIVREMETELRNVSSRLRSIIKAGGLWHPNLNGNTSAVFRVDPNRHFLSLASMFGPSPDWFVGVSGLDLCRSNCSWVDEVDLELLPYDAGTDSGITYMSVKTPSGPGEKVRMITTSEPEDERAPFWRKEGGHIPPLAILHIRRIANVPKPCANQLEPVQIHDNTEDAPRWECSVAEWGDWSECSATCGAGLRARQREYMDAAIAANANCDRQLIAREMCIVRPCPEEEEDDEEKIESLHKPGECEVTSWSDWSDCSVSCGVGFIMRSRRFVNDTTATHKRCSHVPTAEKEKCMLPVCSLPLAPAEAKCRAGEWSEWSPCSVSCGSGVRSRTRSAPSASHKFCRSIELRQTRPCAVPPCAPLPPGTCDLTIEEGPCRGGFERWGFKNGKCQEFAYGGCRGNANNFHSRTECIAACSPGETPENELTKPQDCVVSRWSTWSPCKPCPVGFRTKNRTILVKPKNGGKSCPILEKAIKCTVLADFC